MTFTDESTRVEIHWRESFFEFEVATKKKGKWSRESHGITPLFRDVLGAVRRHSPSLACSIDQQVRPGKIADWFKRAGEAA